jgi:hypothetical protein
MAALSEDDCYSKQIAISEKPPGANGETVSYIKDMTLSLPPLDEYELYLQVRNSSRTLQSLSISKQFMCLPFGGWEFIFNNNRDCVLNSNTERQIRAGESIALLVPVEFHIETERLSRDDCFDLFGEWSDFALYLLKATDKDATYTVFDKEDRPLFQRQLTYACAWTAEEHRLGYSWHNGRRKPVFGSALPVIYVGSRGNNAINQDEANGWTARCLTKQKDVNLPIALTDSGFVKISLPSSTLPLFMAEAVIEVIDSSGQQVFREEFSRIPINPPKIEAIAGTTNDDLGHIQYSISLSSEAYVPFTIETTGKDELMSTNSKIVFSGACGAPRKDVSVISGEERVDAYIDLLGLRLDFDGFFNRNGLSGHTLLPYDYYRHNPDFNSSVVFLSVLSNKAVVTISVETDGSREERSSVSKKENANTNFHLVNLAPPEWIVAKVLLEVQWGTQLLEQELFTFSDKYECGQFRLDVSDHIVLSWDYEFFTDVTLSIAHGSDAGKLDFSNPIDKRLISQGLSCIELNLNSMIINGGVLGVQIERPDLFDEWAMDTTVEPHLVGIVDVPELECGQITAKVDDNFSIGFERQFLTDMVIAVTEDNPAPSDGMNIAVMSVGNREVALGASGVFESLLSAQSLFVWVKRKNVRQDASARGDPSTWHTVATLNEDCIDFSGATFIGAYQELDFENEGTGALDLLNMSMSIALNEQDTAKQLSWELQLTTNLAFAPPCPEEYLRVLQQFFLKPQASCNDLFVSYYILNQPLSAYKNTSMQSFGDNWQARIWAKCPIWGYRALRESFSSTGDNLLLETAASCIQKTLNLSAEWKNDTINNKLATIYRFIQGYVPVVNSMRNPQAMPVVRSLVPPVP